MATQSSIHLTRISTGHYKAHVHRQRFTVERLRDKTWWVFKGYGRHGDSKIIARCHSLKQARAVLADVQDNPADYGLRRVIPPPKRMYSTIRTDTVEDAIAIHQARGNYEAEQAVRDLCRGVPIREDAIAELVAMHQATIERWQS